MTTKKKPETAVTSVRLPVELRDELNNQAEKNFRSMNQEIVFRLRKSVKGNHQAA